MSAKQLKNNLSLVKPAPRQRKREGIVIVEMLVALVVFAIFVAGACKLLVSHRQMSDMARAHYTAVNIAKNRLELVRSFEFGQVDGFLEDKVEVDASGAPAELADYRRSTSVIGVSSNIYELAVTVEIRDRKTLQFSGRQEELTTFFAEYLTENSSVGGGVAPNS
jgi:type II secretory pathway pseudopilin PulG